MTRGRGPKRSARYASKGMSQVSKRIKSVKASWIAALPQWYLSSIGLMKMVQPYCRFATMAMQVMPATSCTRGFELTIEGRGVMFMSVPPDESSECPARWFEDITPPREDYRNSNAEAKHTREKKNEKSVIVAKFPPGFRADRVSTNN